MKSQFVARIKRRSKIGIAFFGILRFGHIAYPIIKVNIIDPAVSLGDGVIGHHFLNRNMFSMLSLMSKDHFLLATISHSFYSREGWTLCG